MRRGLLKDLANTPTQIACGWRMYGDIARLSSLDGSEVTIDLISGACRSDGEELSPPLELAADVSRWMAERLERDGVPEGTVTSATLTLRPEIDRRGLVVACSTVLTIAVIVERPGPPCRDPLRSAVLMLLPEGTIQQRGYLRCGHRGDRQREAAQQVSGLKMTQHGSAAQDAGYRYVGEPGRSVPEMTSAE